ncbi:MAG TPA: transglutaminase family protein [Polyangia bacterium]|jgi:transglutaminase-like putative cysteine protease|nr:transglutaminase family protein [Polyangia bacterium]
MYQIRIGCQLNYFAPTATPSVFIVQPLPQPRQSLLRESFDTAGAAMTGAYVDGFGNRCQRVTLAAGDSVLRYDALASVSRDADAFRPEARAVPPQELPSELLRFTLPSRYAETDELLGFAWERFSRVPAGWERARAICDWAHCNVEYKPGSSAPDWSAADVLARRQGVCRDRAHVVIALCRAFNMPARYAVSYLPDIDVPDDGATMDFHAYAEVWLEGGWHVFDPHGLSPRKGRIFIASGLDAADAAFATLYGAASLTRLRVWADAVPSLVTEALSPIALAPGAAAFVVSGQTMFS